MSRIEEKFRRLKEQGSKALVAYLTAGDPSLEATKEIILRLDRVGVDIVEIGVPFSDPTADGPIIQAASHRALERGETFEAILDMIEEIRAVSEIPIVLFGYYNPILSYGNESFAMRARAAGVDGILVVDLPPEESDELRRYTDRAGIDFISLIAPTTTDERIKKISRDAGGFLYYISVTGVTGTTKPRIADIKRDVKRIRAITTLPVAVGFGISTPEQARRIALHADGVVIGSAFVRLIEENSGEEVLMDIVSGYARSIKDAIEPAL
ncbi:MAG TPA: tryptophan synthase subunit alpha [Syntrophales bacterium]|nr:tryptophan synthase subunit alpha [Syntrophales bacterium]HPQ42690.1 tryptophan synthase subunit alpha [Syntrophales bacterium]